jgi:hypothetical protein
MRQVEYKNQRPKTMTTLNRVDYHLKVFLAFSPHTFLDCLTASLVAGQYRLRQRAGPRLNRTRLLLQAVLT